MVRIGGFRLLAAAEAQARLAARGQGRRRRKLWLIKARRTVVSPPLQRWSSEAAPGERRTAVVRIRFSSDPDQAAARLAGAGVKVHTKGVDTIICVVTPESLAAVAADPAVVSVEEPTRAFPRGIPSSPA